MKQHSAGACGGTCTSDNQSTPFTQFISFAFGNVELNMVLKEKNDRPPKTTQLIKAQKTSKSKQTKTNISDIPEGCWGCSKSIN